MSMLRAVLWPTSRETKLLLEESGRPILRGRLAPLHQSHPAALPALLEALSLWQTRALSAVLAVDAQAPAWSWTGFRFQTERVIVEPCLVGRRVSLRELRGAAQTLWEQHESEGRHAL